jgi:CheY-like chemotaxis protein
MRRQIDHMRRLVDDLLDVSRITRGKFEIRREPVLLQEVLERSLETVAPAANAARPPIEVDAPLAPVWVQGDETRLVQAVSNLLSNAMRYGGEGRISLALETPEGVARVIVQDEGSGMDAETLRRAFDPFYQAPQNSARKLGGLGLGLAIVQSIVSLHGGVVVASSAGPGCGSRFVVDLPTIPAPTDTSAPEIAQAHRRTGKVAIVDDNVDALEMVAGALRTAGHEVEAFSDPRQALARIPAFMPDVAILDLGMPDMNGLELAAALRASGWAGRLVALTGYGQEADKRRSAEAGFVLHLTKPMDVVTLLASVESLVRPS